MYAIFKSKIWNMFYVEPIREEPTFWGLSKQLIWMSLMQMLDVYQLIVACKMLCILLSISIILTVIMIYKGRRGRQRQVEEQKHD